MFLEASCVSLRKSSRTPRMEKANDMNDQFVEDLLAQVCKLQRAGVSNKDILAALSLDSGPLIGHTPLHQTLQRGR